MFLSAAWAQSQELPAGWRGLHQQPGWQALLAGTTVVVVEDGFTHLRGLDPSGRPLWRTKYQDAPRGMQQLFVVDGRPLMYGGETLSSLDPRTGRIESQQRVPFLSGSFPREYGGGCWLNDRRGACALGCDCSFQLVSCRSGAPLGTRYDFDRICRYSHGKGGGLGPKSCGCWGHGGTILGRSGEVIVAELHGLKRESAGGAPRNAVVGVDARSGREVWRSAAGPEPASYIDGAGVTPSGRTCWLADAFGALTALDCASGRTLWAVKPTELEPPHRPESWVTGLREPAAIFQFTGARATLYAERTGTRLWSADTKGAAFAAPRGTLPAGYVARRGTGAPGALLLLEPRTGSPSARIDLPHKGASIIDAGRGRVLVVMDRELRLHDPSGALVARATLPFAANVLVGEQLLAAFGQEGLAVLDKTTLRARGRLAGWYQVTAVEGALGPRRLLGERLGDPKGAQPQLRQILLLEVTSLRE